MKKKRNRITKAECVELGMFTVKAKLLSETKLSHSSRFSDAKCAAKYHNALLFLMKTIKYAMVPYTC